MATAGDSERGRSPLVRIVTLVLVAAGSATAGFFLVVLLAGDARVATEDTADEPEETAHAEPTSAADEDDGDGSDDVTASEVSLGEPYYFRCFGEGADRPVEGSCGRLPGIERLVASRLAAAERCRSRSSNPVSEGLLSLGIDVDFGANTMRLWSARSTTVPAAEEIVACLRGDFEGFDVASVRRRHHRYTVFFPIRFGAQPDASVQGEDTAKTVRIALDRVRLRAEPERGKILARLRQGEPVQLLESRDEWVRVRTADGREGWVFEPAVGGE